MQRLQRAAFEARYEAADKLHITLTFLGNVERDRIGGITSIIDRVASETPAFELTIDKLGAFPNERRPRIIFLGSRTQSNAFRSLSNRLRNAYNDLGFELCDDAIAHITIARVKGGSNRPLPALDVAPMRVPVREISLFESIPEKETTRYVVRHTASLQGS